MNALGLEFGAQLKRKYMVFLFVSIITDGGIVWPNFDFI